MVVETHSAESSPNQSNYMRKKLHGAQVQAMAFDSGKFFVPAFDT